MNKHRCIPPLQLNVGSFLAPFSCFECVETLYSGNPAIHRCFSLARSCNARSLIIETIAPTGLIAEENAELLQLGFKHTPSTLLRLSFWKCSHRRAKDTGRLQVDDLLGFAILKRDIVPGISLGNDGWHVFEAVFRKYAHAHNCVPGQVDYQVRIGEGVFKLPGVLYCQQNGLNKACAHVALRSLLSRLIDTRDVSYTEMNRLAKTLVSGVFLPKEGLNVQQIRKILQHFGVNFRDVDYGEAEKLDPAARTNQPYQKYIYAGVESGYGGLLGFSMTGPQAPDTRHIIPFYGHTFNKDTWVPDAQASYFNIGGGMGYIPSESWTSSYIGHDDNFGPNFCIPRLYVKPEQAQYVVEIIKPGVQYNGVVAEVQALQFLYSLYPHMDGSNHWQVRLAENAHPSHQRVVMRAMCVERKRYLEHLKTVRDWEGRAEDNILLDKLGTLLPKLLWVVEVSLPHLFPANERKLGEIVLDACRAPDTTLDVDFGLFVLARLPGQFVVSTGQNGNAPSFETAPSGLQSHVPVLRSED